MWMIHLFMLGTLSSIIIAEQDCKWSLTCSDCIQTQGCMWCSKPGNLTDGDRELYRCVKRSSPGVWRDLCGLDYIQEPENYFEMLTNQEFSPAHGYHYTQEDTIVQLKPQRVAMKLRVKESNSMQLTYQHHTHDQSVLQGTFAKIEMQDNASWPIDIRYFSKCKGISEQETSLCDGLTVGDIVVFRLEIKVRKCPNSADEWNQIIFVQPVGLPDKLIIDLMIICECNCEQPTHPRYKLSVEACNGLGTMMYGVCSCDEGFFGHQCEQECGSNTPWGHKGKSSYYGCIKPSYPLVQLEFESICSGRGTCDCGECLCEERPNPEEKTDGKFCQCTNYLCDRHNGMLCSGPDHGKCVCNECECEPEWTGPACNCEYSEENCINPENGRVCSGQGKCECNECKCYETTDGYFYGKWCEDCPTCKGKCEAYKPCVQCFFQTCELTPEESQTICSTLDGLIVQVAEVETEEERLCTFFDENDCKFTFVYGYNMNNDQVVRIQEKLECPPKLGNTDLGDREVSMPVSASPTLNLNHPITFTTRAAMFSYFRQCTLGSIAYVMDDDSLFMRGAQGWRQVMLSVPLGP